MPSQDKYTDPELRDQVKEEIKQSDKGGEPGQWSARKAQMMAKEYKNRGGGYTTDKENGQDESQKNLEKWTEEEWQTKDGEGEARQSDGTRKRYLPKRAWEQMDEEEKKETDDKKQASSKQGQQFVGNTQKAKNARQQANEEEHEDFEQRKQQNGKGQNGTSKGQQSKNKQDQKGKTSKPNGKAEKDDNENQESVSEYEQEEDDEEEEDDDNDDGQDEVDAPDEDGEEAYQIEEDEEEEQGISDGNESSDEEVGDDAEDEPDQKASSGQKRGRNNNMKSEEQSPSKKQKPNGNLANGNSKPERQADGTLGSKHDSAEAPAQVGSKDRLPKKGQRVTWKAMPGWVHGEVLEIATDNKEVEGKQVKAGKDNPKVVLRADSGKVCEHKPDACYFD